MLKALIDAKVEFLIVGAHAMAIHGVPRATGDMDILVRPNKENAKLLVSALRSFGAPLASHGVSEADFVLPGTVYQLGLPPKRIDLLTQISGVSFEDAWESRVRVQVAGLEVAFLGKRELIQNKQAAGRDKDLLDVRILKSKDGG